MAPTEPAPLAETARNAAARTDARIAVAIAGPILFTPPLLALADRGTMVFGIPTLVVYIFTAWLVGIVVTALAARSGRRGRHDPR